MAGVPGIASAIFGAVNDVGANVIMISQVLSVYFVFLFIFYLVWHLHWMITKNYATQASSEHSVCFAVPETEVQAVAAALESRFRQALDAGRLSQVVY